MRQHIKKHRHPFADKGPYSQSYGFSSSHVLMLEKAMATPSSILDWKIPWPGEPGGLQSMGLQRVRLNLVTEEQQQPSPSWCNGKESHQCRKCRRCGFDPWIGKTHGIRNGSLLQGSCLEHPIDRGPWWATVQGAKSWTQLND